MPGETSVSLLVIHVSKPSPRSSWKTPMSSRTSTVRSMLEPVTADHGKQFRVTHRVAEGVVRQDDDRAPDRRNRSASWTIRALPLNRRCAAACLSKERVRQVGGPATVKAQEVLRDINEARLPIPTRRRLRSQREAVASLLVGPAFRSVVPSCGSVASRRGGAGASGSLREPA